MAQSLFLRIPALLECLEVAMVEFMGLTWDIIPLLLLVMFLQWYLGTSQWDDYSIDDVFDSVFVGWMLCFIFSGSSMNFKRS